MVDWGLMATLSTNVIEKHCILPKFEHGWPGCMWMTLHYLDKKAKMWKRVGHRLEENTTYVYENAHKEIKVFKTKIKRRRSDTFKIYYFSELETTIALTYPVESVPRCLEDRPEAPYPYLERWN